MKKHITCWWKYRPPIRSWDKAADLPSTTPVLPCVPLVSTMTCCLLLHVQPFQWSLEQLQPPPGLVQLREWVWMLWCVDGKGMRVIEVLGCTLSINTQNRSKNYTHGFIMACIEIELYDTGQTFVSHWKARIWLPVAFKKFQTQPLNPLKPRPVSKGQPTPCKTMHAIP